LRIYPGNGVPPGSESWDWRERTAPVPNAPAGRTWARNVVIPTLTAFRPLEGKANGTAIVIAPGGAFHFLMMDHEGYDLARPLVALGVTAFVLKYRLLRTPDDDEEMVQFRAELGPKLGRPTQTETEPPRREFMDEIRRLSSEDGRQAIRYIRDHAADWGVDPGKVGIAGFSAGGGVAMGVAFEHDAQSRPDFVAAIYPAYRTGPAVPDDACPLFLVTADDDKSVAPISTARLHEAWHKANKPVELHVFGNGGHGFGMNQPGLRSDLWADLFVSWLASHGLLAAKEPRSK
jgi:acetyl esterase/lipase